MKFKCDYDEEYVDLQHCENECDREECEQYAEIERKERNVKSIQDSELKKQVMESIGKNLGLPEEKVTNLVNSMFSNLIHYTEESIQGSIKELIKIKIQELISEKIDNKINELFEKALSDEILKIDKDNVSVVNIQADIEKRIMRFLNDGYDRRKTLDSSVDACVKKIADNKVSDVLAEIKEETIDKFNKEMMKKMMTGMAVAISDDKRLLTLLDL